MVYMDTKRIRGTIYHSIIIKIITIQRVVFQSAISNRRHMEGPLLISIIEDHESTFTGVLFFRPVFPRPPFRKTAKDCR